VTPDGRYLAFMSVKRLTGYDNEDQATGEADHEVFEYSAETGQLACASCDASGERPLGSAFIGATLIQRVSTPFHQPRSLSDDGSRLFFSSPDPLVPGLSGGSTKLFEYEDGTAQLISGTQGGGSAMFLDASASGKDVFFATREQLAATDTDEQGSVCREPLASPPPSPTPVSASFAGPGNRASSPTVKLTRGQLLSRALSRCRRLKNGRQRAACFDAARRRYAPKARRARPSVVPARR